jgi:hypothetical protein
MIQTLETRGWRLMNGDVRVTVKEPAGKKVVT